MKAIINITNKKNQYSKFNGLTFRVGDLLKDGLGLIGVNQDFPKNQTDFNFNEIIIVDIELEYSCLCSELNTVIYGIEGVKKNILNLNNYISKNKIQIKLMEFTDPI
jgi:hypothetical protein